MPKKAVVPLEKKMDEKVKSSLDYPYLARKLLEASGEEGISKLPAHTFPAGLYIVATPIGNLGDITLRALSVLAAAGAIACEDTRVSGGMLAKYGIKAKLISYHDHNAEQKRPEILRRLENGEVVALISDAGMPVIADPGFKLVQACRECGHRIEVIPGANAAVTALAGAGLPIDKFLFAGFLPPRTTARVEVIRAFRDVPVTLVFYEAPQRLAGTLTDLAKVLGGDRNAAVARELTKLFEETKLGTLDELEAFYGMHDVKGEIVIIVGPPEKKKVVVPLHDLDALLKEHLRTLSVRDAVAAVCDITKMKKNEVYARALWLSGRNV